MIQAIPQTLKLKHVADNGAALQSREHTLEFKGELLYQCFHARTRSILKHPLHKLPLPRFHCLAKQGLATSPKHISNLLSAVGIPKLGAQPRLSEVIIQWVHDNTVPTISDDTAIHCHKNLIRLWSWQEPRLLLDENILADGPSANVLDADVLRDLHLEHAHQGLQVSPCLGVDGGPRLLYASRLGGDIVSYDGPAVLGCQCQDLLR
mmetsp:Transcript_11549/g.26848  ORF Transcript_11549/g.26848 Transcript_11549/m.26848 type:complete len:207 (+) Transcript_11549:1913-2533(+)